MKSRLQSAGKMTLREMILLSLISAMMVATKVAMMILPNIHLVAVFIILAALLFGWKSLFSIYVFVIVDGFIHGFGTWFVGYLYIWTILAIVTILFQNNRSRLFWALISGIYGLLFGTLFTPAYMITEGWAAALGRWIYGIPYDLIHCVSNFAMTYVLLMPLYHLCMKLIGADMPQKKTQNR